MTRFPPAVFSALIVAALAGCASTPASSAASSASSPDPATGAARPLVARAQPSFPLWASGAPGALGTAPTDRPTMTPYLPPEGGANGTAVVVFPGGGYTHLSMVKEGSDVANWLASTGVTAFVVQYRLGPAYHHPAMLDDAQRAIRTVRARAAEWGVDPARVGIIGFSAGGHLASTAGTHFDMGAASNADPIERASSRPDFMMLIYPVITMRGDSTTHAGSRLNLLGADPSPKLVRLLSNETQVTAQTPPAFLVHTFDDRTVPVQNSLLFYDALQRAGVAAELHVFDHGPHGFGLAPADPVLSAWPGLAEAWMRRHGWIGASP
jgi:acetyl esterase/lipase